MKKTEKHIKHKKQLLFKAIAISLPLFFVLLLELCLRLSGYGYSFDLFKEYQPNKDFLVFNPDASKRYFTDPRFAPTGNRELFKKTKDPNTIRFFVLGESTTIGYPYFHNGSFHRWLLYRLMHSYPEKHFEIINLSLTAVNSYTIKTFAEELANYEPDGVLIYAGQNEFYGGLGVGSAQTIGGNPAVVNTILKIRSLRTVQLLMNLYGKIAGRINKQPEEEMTRMELMVGEQKIPYQSELYFKGINQFRYNMDATLKTLRQKNIPVFFSNLVSNVKDLPPFISDEQDEHNAAYYYREAQSSCNREDYIQAYEYFAKAKDLDLLRFRAPEVLNMVIQELCDLYPNTYFVNTKNELEEHAPYRILGNELFTDHVHPNLKGYGLMSNAFFETIINSGLLPQPKQEMTKEQLLQAMPVSPIDSIAGEFRIMKLKGHWPFYDSSYANISIPENTIEEKLAARFFRKEVDWLSVHNTLYTAYIQLNQPHKAAKIAEGTVLEYAEDPVFYESAAMINGESGNIESASFYLEKSYAFTPSFEKAHYLMVFYLMTDQPEKALPYLNYAIKNNTKGFNLNSLKPLVEQVINQKKSLMSDPYNTVLMNDIAGSYLKMDNKNGAIIYINKLLQIDPANEKALHIKNSLNN